MSIQDTVLGSVIPIPVPFHDNEEIDYKSLKNYVTFLVENGIKNVMTTVGSSRYNLLDEAEIKKVNKTVVQAANGKAKVVVANALVGNTKKSIEYGQHAQEIGADFYLVIFPERFYGDQYIIEFFEEIAKNTTVPILIHEMPLRNGYGGAAVQYSLDLLEKLFNIEGVVGLKEESLNKGYSRQILQKFGKKQIIIGAGGGMSRYLEDYQYGSKAFLGGIGNFYPKLELAFFKAMQEKNFELANKIVYQIEIPYFNAIGSLGWHPSLKAALFLTNHMLPFDRKPFKQCSKEEEIYLQKVLDDLKQTIDNLLEN